MQLDWQTLDLRGAAQALDGLFVGPVTEPALPGGATAARKHLADYDPGDYGRTRNFLRAPVSRLSAYLRHGMLTMPEVRDHLRATFKGAPEQIEELLRQLAWRDFFLKVLDWYGEAITDDLEPPKHSTPRSDDLPRDVAEGRTGLPCIDGMLQRLFETGYLHNHERLWFAAYLCHYRGVRWQAGADLFQQHLLDGDLASNNASWQWVESTFASKPYFMNRDNIERFSDGEWCRTCRVKCPFAATYERLEITLFQRGRAPLAPRE